MTNRLNTKRDLIWGFAAQALQYGAMLLLLPILATRMTSSEVGLWFVFMSIQSLVMLLDVGFGNSLSRSFSYIFAGANRLLNKGVDVGNVGNEIDPRLLATTIQTGRLLYTLVAFVVCIFLASLGTFYIDNLGGLEKPNGKLAWILFCTAVVTNIYFQWYLPLLIGSGRVRENYKAIIIVRGGFTLLAAGTLMIKPTLWGVSISYLLAVLIMVIYARIKLKDILKASSSEIVKHREILENFNVLWHNSYRMGLVSIGAFMITKLSVLLVASNYGLEISASYSITLQIFSAISAVALVPFNALLPKIAALRLTGHKNTLKEILCSVFVISWCIALLGTTLIILFGHEVLSLIGSKTNIVEFPLLTLIAITALLELNHGASAMVIMSSNRVPFVPAAILSGTVIFLLSVVSTALDFPLWTIVAIQTITQLAYNNWKWPLMVIREFEFNTSDITAAANRLARGNL